MAAACNLAIAKFFFSVRSNALEFRDAVNSVDGETEPVRLVVNRKLHRRVDVALFFVATHMQVAVIRAAVRVLIIQVQRANLMQGGRGTGFHLRQLIGPKVKRSSSPLLCNSR